MQFSFQCYSWHEPAQFLVLRGSLIKRHAQNQHTAKDNNPDLRGNYVRATCTFTGGWQRQRQIFAGRPLQLQSNRTLCKPNPAQAQTSRLLSHPHPHLRSTFIFSSTTLKYDVSCSINSYWDTLPPYYPHTLPTFSSASRLVRLELAAMPGARATIPVWAHNVFMRTTSWCSIHVHIHSRMGVHKPSFVFAHCQCFCQNAWHTA